MMNLQLEKPRGILNLKEGEKRFSLSRHLPSPDLAFFIEHYWIVRWNLINQPPYLSENLPYPSVHLVFEKDNSRIVGVIRGKFSYLLQGQGQVFGVKFRPGAFYPFLKLPVSRFTDSLISFQAAFGIASKPLEEIMLSLEDEAQMVALAEKFIRERLPEQDENVELVNRIVNCIINDREILMVDDLVKRLSLTKRTLQRLFSQYVGASPKWVINRYRLHEAAEQLASGKIADWSRLAVDLGYFDQAHFIKDFKKIVGKTPAEYARHLE